MAIGEDYIEVPDNDEQIEIVDSEQRDEIPEELERIRAMRDELGEDGITPEEQALLAQYERKTTPDTTKHYANLAEGIEENALNAIAQEVLNWVEWDEESRAEWQKRERAGIRSMGVSPNVDGGAPFSGASDAVHPLLGEACVQFNSRALDVMWPAGGPIRGESMGSTSAELEEQAKRVESFMNYQYTELMPGAFDQTDSMLLRLPLSGSVFVKPHYDKIDGIVRHMVEPADFIVPYRATSLRTSPRFTERILMDTNDVRKRQVAGVYRDLSLIEPYEETHEQEREVVIDEVRATEGRQDQTHTNDDHRRTLYECYCALDLAGHEDKGDDGTPTGIKLPYVVTVDKDSQVVLSIRRNWKPDDSTKRKIIYYAHYKFTPGLGFYGYGLYHLIGGLSKAATGSLRALMDAAMLANLQGGYRSKDAGLKPGDDTITPGEWKEVDCEAQDLAKAFYRIPYGEPSSTLFNLMVHIETLGQRFAGTTETLVGEGNQNTPVGTILARIEQGSKVISAVQKRLHEAAKEEYRLVAWLNSLYMPERYPYQVKGEDRFSLKADFDRRVDVVPVSDPTFVSNAQRYFISKAVLELADSAPDLYDRREVHRRALESLRIDEIDKLLPPPTEVPRAGPVQEIATALTGQPIKAFIEQNHLAHIQVHQQFLMVASKDQLESAGAAIQAHIQEHMAMQFMLEMSQLSGVSVQGLMAGEQIPVEIENEIALRCAQAMQQLPPRPESPDPEAIEVEREQARKDAIAAAESQRKDALAKADMRRKDALAKSDISRKTEQALEEATRKNEEAVAELYRRGISNVDRQ